jgi:hypothetical protein
MLEIVDLTAHSVESAGTPASSRCCFVLQERIAALDETICPDAKEGASIVKALPSISEELCHMPGRFFREELNPKRTEICGNSCFNIGGVLGSTEMHDSRKGQE